MTPFELDLEMYSNADYQEQIAMARTDGGDFNSTTIEIQIRKTRTAATVLSVTPVFVVDAINPARAVLTITIPAADVNTLLDAGLNKHTAYWGCLLDVGDGIKRPVMTGKAKVIRGIPAWV